MLARISSELLLLLAGVEGASLDGGFSSEGRLAFFPVSVVSAGVTVVTESFAESAFFSSFPQLDATAMIMVERRMHTLEGRDFRISKI